MDIPFDDKLIVLDVRKPNEFAEGHINKAINIPLNELTDPGKLAFINEDNNLYIHCTSGYRSVIAASLLKRQGIHNIHNVKGGWDQIRALEKVEITKEKSILN